MHVSQRHAVRDVVHRPPSPEPNDVLTYYETGIEAERLAHGEGALELARTKVGRRGDGRRRGSRGSRPRSRDAVGGQPDERVAAPPGVGTPRPTRSSCCWARTCSPCAAA